MTDPREDDNFMMGALAAQDAYRGEYPAWPPSPSYPPARVDAGNAQVGAIGNTLRRMVMPATESFRAPTGYATPSTYPEGSEEAQFQQNVKDDRAAQFGGEWALNLLAPSRVLTGRNALGVGGGSKIVQPAPKMGDLAEEAPKVAVSIRPTPKMGALAEEAPSLANVSGTVQTPPANISGTTIDPSGLARPSIIERYYEDPQRIYKKGVYRRPDVLARMAEARVAPEHPAMKELFGVTRGDLYDISQAGRRQGNAQPNIIFPANPGGSYAAENIMTPANAQRMVDTIGEAKKLAPELTRGMVPWYVMDPAFQRMEQLVGREQAIRDYNRFNSTMTPFSASSDVMKEINRGTAARMMAERNEFLKYQRYNGIAEADRGTGFPPELADVISHPYHDIHTQPVGKYLQTGSHGYGADTVKIPLYTQASGVPQTGFQTAWAVPDAHFTRAAGMSDVRKNASPGDYMGGPEYRTFAPWFREHVAAPSGLEAVPTQALMWGAYAPQTGVKTTIGAPKLELLSQRIWERALKLGIDPRVLRDQVLRGEQHSELTPAMGDLADQSRYG